MYQWLLNHSRMYVPQHTMKPLVIISMCEMTSVYRRTPLGQEEPRRLQKHWRQTGRSQSWCNLLFLFIHRTTYTLVNWSFKLVHNTRLKSPKTESRIVFKQWLYAKTLISSLKTPPKSNIFGTVRCEAIEDHSLFSYTPAVHLFRTPLRLSTFTLWLHWDQTLCPIFHS